MSAPPPATRGEELAAALARVEERLAAAAAAAGRPREDVQLVAVSKTWPLADVEALAALGPRDFGESRDQEAGPKAAARPDLTWHFVGRLQTNKARRVAGYADVVHSLDREALVAPLARGAADAGRVLRVLVQVALDEHPDPGRGGAVPADVPALADAAAAAGLVVGGVMAVAPLGAPPRPAFARLREVAESLRRSHPGAAWVSAGMSGDLEEAVAEGATHVRVGTALFGVRPPLTH